MDLVSTMVAAAADSDGGVNPVFFAVGGLALIVVSTLGPLSRWHEHRGTVKKEAAARAAAETPAAEASADWAVGSAAPEDRTD